MKLHYLSAICSAGVVGLGQIIKGESKKAVLLLLAFYFLVPALAYGSLLMTDFIMVYVLGFAIIFGIIAWLYSVLDALVR